MTDGGELRAVEILMQEMAAEFDEEDPLLPNLRDMLNDARLGLEELIAEMGERLGGGSIWASPARRSSKS